mmetsp:Transcript_68045/g.79151  ORF Transcript_68045/g.79151 Transcript_68045/m.79151 type:complete len:232 (+) Transcript_68045:614-1309(+)
MSNSTNPSSSPMLHSAKISNRPFQKLLLSSSPLPRIIPSIFQSSTRKPKANSCTLHSKTTSSQDLMSNSPQSLMSLRSRTIQRLQVSLRICCSTQHSSQLSFLLNARRTNQLLNSKSVQELFSKQLSSQQSLIMSLPSFLTLRERRLTALTRNQVENSHLDHSLIHSSTHLKLRRLATSSSKQLNILDKIKSKSPLLLRSFLLWRFRLLTTKEIQFKALLFSFLQHLRRTS